MLEHKERDLPMPEASHTVGIVMPNWLAQRAAITPHQTALIHGCSSWTFAEFDRRATAMARQIAGAPGPIDPAGDLDSAVPLQRSIDLSAVATVIYTSGTTGRPKGALLTYGNHWWSAVGSAFHLGAHTDDRWLAVLPLFHVGGLA